MSDTVAKLEKVPSPGLKYGRVMLKISGEALAGKQGFGIDPPAIEKITDEIYEVLNLGVQLGIVVGGGNIVRGTIASERGMDRVSADYMGMMATVINAIAMQDLLEKRGLDTRVLTAIRMEELAEPYIRRRAIRHLEKGRVVIFAGGTGNPYFSTDTCAVLRAIEMEAELILKATKVNGIYTADPEKDVNAKFIPRISYLDVIQRKLMVMDNTEITLSMNNGLTIVIFNLNSKGAIKRILLGEQVGTLVGE